MNKKEFDRYLARDKSQCYHCGASGETLVPQHRSNRGMGGSKKRHTPSNIIVFCSEANGLIESDPYLAKTARENGWKLESWQDTQETPVYNFASQSWFVLDSDYNRTATEEIDADNQGRTQL